MEDTSSDGEGAQAEGAKAFSAQKQKAARGGGEVGVMGGGLHKCPGNLYDSNSSYLFWVAEKWEGRWMRILLQSLC